MGDGPATPGSTSGQLTIVGLGPGDFQRLPEATRQRLLDPTVTVVVRTLRHPAAEELAASRPVIACDDLYETAERFGDVYEAIAERVLSIQGETVYAVPGSPLVGEFAVRILLEREPDAEVIPSESFLDAVLAEVGYDPFDRGLRIINGHELPTPLALDAPTVIGHLDRPEILADVASALSRVLPEGAEVTLCVDLGTPDAEVLRVPVDEVPADRAGLRTSMFVDTDPAGLIGVVAVSWRLRRECPWDRKQTHQTLLRHLIEETYELADAIAALPAPEEEVDYVAYSDLEEELGDVLLQVLFHSAIAAENGAFDVDDVATRLREKLVRRHPHVFGDVEVADADEVIGNWERIKAEEKGSGAESLLDGVPAGLPGLDRAEKLQQRAASVGFDWAAAEEVVPVLRREVEELEQALGTDREATIDEAGDVLFTIVNLLRHLDVPAELTMRRAVDRFERRFRAMEEEGPLAGLTQDELEERWKRAKTIVG